MGSPAKRVVAFLRRSLSPAGLDVIIPLTLERYNAFLANDTTAASDLSRFTLPTPTPADGDAPPLQSHLMVLVGNSRAIWEPFLKHVAEELESEGRVLADPIDRYIQQSVANALAACEAEEITPPAQTYWVADTEPGKMILAQKMAVAARAVSRCAPSQICLHPVLGPWLAFRCAMVFPLEGIPEEPEKEEEGDEDSELLHQPAECNHDEEMHLILAAQMDEALGQVTKDKLPQILPDAWKKWVMPRITIAPNHPMMYTNDQILYHYTKDLKYLAKVVKAKQRNIYTDYLREGPSKAAIEFRQLFQKVLQGWTKPYPDGVDAISLSGGLDTSIIAEASAQPWQCELGDGAFSLDKTGGARPILKFKHAFTVRADPRAKDAEYARGIYGRLKGISIKKQHILERSLDQLLQNATNVARLLVTCDPMELRNSLVIYATLEEAARQGVRQIVTGDGADEIFCGYSFYANMEEDQMLAYRDQIMDVMGFTAPTLARAFNIDVIAPFLDKRVLAFAKKLKKCDLIGEQTPVPVRGPGVNFGKLVMRQAFPESFSQWRWKEPIEEGSGTTALRMGYFDDYCTPDEFDEAQHDAMQTHGVFVRDHEHLFFFRAFLEAFGNDLSKVPKKRSAEPVDSSSDKGFCPACRFKLSHEAQDFCVTCGFWPTCATPTNDSQGFATQALAQLASDKERLMAA